MITQHEIDVRDFDGKWSERFQRALKYAQDLSNSEAKNVTVRAPAASYRVDVPFEVRGNVDLLFGSGIGSRHARVHFDLENGSTLVHMAGGNYRTIAGAEFRTTGKQESIVGISVESAVNCSIRNMRVDLTHNTDSQPLLLRRSPTSRYNLESLSVESAHLLGTQPIHKLSGDNNCFRDCDLTCNNNAKDLKPGCVVYGPNSGPDHDIFEGYQTWQGGEVALEIDTERSKSSSGLILRNVRYEQSTIDTTPAWIFKFNRSACDLIVMDGVRNSPRDLSVHHRNVTRIDIRHGSKLFGGIVDLDSTVEGVA